MPPLNKNRGGNLPLCRIKEVDAAVVCLLEAGDCGICLVSAQYRYAGTEPRTILNLPSERQPSSETERGNVES